MRRNTGFLLFAVVLLIIGGLVGNLMAKLDKAAAQGPPPPPMPGASTAAPSQPSRPMMPMRYMGPAYVAANEKFVFVTANGMLYKYNVTDLKLAGKSTLEMEMPGGMMPGMMPGMQSPQRPVTPATPGNTTIKKGALPANFQPAPPPPGGYINTDSKTARGGLNK